MSRLRSTARFAVCAGLAASLTLAAAPVVALAEATGPEQATATATSPAPADPDAAFSATVNGAAYATLAEAVAAAPAGSVIELQGSYQGSADAPVTVNKSLTFKGAQQASGYAATLNDVVFEVTDGASLAIDGLELTGNSKVHDANA